MKKTIAFRTAAAASALGLALTLAACSSTDASTEADSTDAQQDEAVTAESALTLENGWVKAVDRDHGMTAVFGILKNSSDKDIHFTGADSSVAGMTELHETVEDNSGSTKMQEKDGGFIIPAGGELTLEPGGDHIMLMKLKEGIEPGAEVTATLKTDVGDMDVTVPAKEFAGAQEEYDQGDGDGMDHGDHDGYGDDEHDGHDHGGEDGGDDH